MDSQQWALPRRSPLRLARVNNIGQRQCSTTTPKGGRAAKVLPLSLKAGNVSGGAVDGHHIDAPVKVMCRFRPEMRVEQQLLERRQQAIAAVGGPPMPPFDIQVDSTTPATSRVRLVCDEMRKNGYQFEFDRVFSEAASQAEVFDASGREMCDKVLLGFNASILLYGQTSAGKTFTMFGPRHFLESFDAASWEDAGIALRCAAYMFERMPGSDGEDERSPARTRLTASFVEVYNEKIYDLLNGSREVLMRDDRHTQGVSTTASTHRILSLDNLINLIRDGARNRTSATTQMNVKSSRSHALLILTLEQPHSSEPTATMNSTLTLVDLAGSERQSKTETSGLAAEESNRINLSLLYLGMVVRALSCGKGSGGAPSCAAKHVPFMNSKLTRLLAESIGGNSATSIILHCSSSQWNAEESLSTLRFGERARGIRNRARLNTVKAPVDPAAAAAFADLMSSHSAPPSRSNSEGGAPGDVALAERAQIRDLEEAVLIHEVTNGKLERVVRDAIAERDELREKLNESAFEYEVQMQVLRSRLDKIRVEIKGRRRDAAASLPSPRSCEAAVGTLDTAQNQEFIVAPSDDGGSPIQRKLERAANEASFMQAELATMKEVVSQKELEISSLRELLRVQETSRNEQVESLARQLHLKGASCAAAEKRIESLSSDVAVLTDENDTLRAALRQQSELLSSREETFKARKALMKDEISRLRCAVAELRRAFDVVGSLAESPSLRSQSRSRSSNKQAVDVRIDHVDGTSPHEIRPAPARLLAFSPPPSRTESAARSFTPQPPSQSPLSSDILDMTSP